MREDFVGLYELQSSFKEALEGNFPEKLWVKAEISSIQARSNGHCYLELSESDSGGVVAKVKAVIWRNRYQILSHYFREVTGGDMAAGMSLLFRCQVNYSELYGLSLVIDEMEPEFTLGEAEKQKRLTIEKLAEQGLLDKQKSLQPSVLPYNLAVISARDAAGFGDFCRHLEENEYGFVFKVDLFEAAMQGSGAPASIVGVLERVESSETRYDAVLVMRGGGSALDLACFDDYGLCFAIANCSIPVYTAIGHDRDFHVADMVAYEYVKTPTALSDLFIDAFAAEDERLSSFSTRLKLAFVSKISAVENKLGMLESRIASADPRKVLSRGYTLVVDSKERVLKSPENVKVGDRIKILFENFEIEAEVKLKNIKK